MLHVVETSKNVETAARDLEEAVKRNGFGVLHVYDLRAKLKEKGVDFPNECRILEVCNPQQAAKVLTADMTVSLGLPCRISVYQDSGRTKIGTVLPTALLAMFPSQGEMQAVAEEVEVSILKMIEEAR
ncbi:MAG TPA: DUF302 domain-containing protein [Deferrisomatales bacterium]|nr:DUF302 domain-containing protein [Deferrisomatales bacterium]